MEISKYKDHEFTPPIRELYIQTQHWARHNENLIIATNGLVLSGAVAIVSTAIKNNQALNTQYLLLLGGISFIGIVLTLILNLRYLRTVERLVSYEALFGFHFELSDTNEPEKTVLTSLSKGSSKWGKCLVPDYLHKRPKLAPESVWFFGFVHITVLIVVLTSLCPYLPNILPQ